MKKNFKNKKVLITGHTGFKGSWLTLWMKLMGAKILGISYGEVSKPSNFNTFKLKDKILSKKINIKNFNALNKEITNFKPNYIFHLAAEAIVKKAYADPKNAWTTNTLGTLNILETLRNYHKDVTVVIITSDKVYQNIEVSRGYKENDIMANTDPYSASKACADIATQSYINTFLKKKKNIKIAIARAGNVIGGGDWATGRLIPDCIRSWSKNKKVSLRSPYSTRPWQHVLDVLHGYILLAIHLNKNKNLDGEIFNFGPTMNKKNNVLKVIRQTKIFWKEINWKVDKESNFYESKLLHLNSSKAKTKLNWSCILDFKKNIFFTINWYRFYLKNKKDIVKFSLNQIEQFISLKKKK
jgi:CDP-glucose 4,6-dehydratase